MLYYSFLTNPDIKYVKKLNVQVQLVCFNFMDMLISTADCVSLFNLATRKQEQTMSQSLAVTK